jgi:predicted RNase H-like nuclease (RuvC/YqgF family)
MTDDMKKLTSAIAKCRKMIEGQQKNKVDFSRKVDEVEKKIYGRYDQLKQLIEREQANLLGELESYKRNRIKQVEIVVKELEQHVSFTESLVNYIQELKNKSTASDIARQTNSLRVRANELQKLDAIQQAVDDLGSADVTFTASTWSTNSSGDILGKIHMQRKFIMEILHSQMFCQTGEVSTSNFTRILLVLFSI